MTRENHAATLLAERVPVRGGPTAGELVLGSYTGAVP